MNKKPMLTRGEEEIMQILWRLENASVSEIIACIADPKPKHTTVATFLKILENKGCVAHVAEGKVYRYRPTLDRKAYAQTVVSSMLSNYFDGSLSRMVSFFSERERLSVEEMDEILELMKRQRP